MIARILLALLAVVIATPVAIALVVGTGSLLAAMGDADGARLLRYIGLGLSLLWALGFVGLVIILAVQALSPSLPDQPPTTRTEEEGASDESDA